jgi:hypothetical protein
VKFDKDMDLNKVALDVDGGAVWLVVGGVLVCLGCFALGAYNGYKDTKDQKK